MIDKNVEALSKFADRHTVLDKGQVVWSGNAAELAADPGVIDRYLHL